MFSDLGWAVLQLAAVAGLGSRALSLLRIPRYPTETVWIFLSVSLGYLLQSWLLFFLGLAGLFSFPAAIAVMAGGILIADRHWITVTRTVAGQFTDPVRSLLLLGLLAALTLYVIEGLAPPTDADTNGYHLSIPRQFAEAGGIFAIPRAIDGLAPLLVQTGYLPPLLAGGIGAATAWYALAGFLGGLSVYPLMRRFLPITPSLLGALLAATTPAVVYGATSGQVETRIMLFVTACLISWLEYRRTGSTAWLILAGLFCGAYAGSKYLGLFFGATMCVLLIATCRLKSPKALLLFVLSAAVAGGQWYGWNWHVTGDPVFPALTGLLAGGGEPFWDSGYAERLKEGIISGERTVDRTLLWWLAYPFVTTFGGPAGFEAGRTGLGPAMLLALPFAVTGWWLARRAEQARPVIGEAFQLLAAAGLFYSIWWWFGETQRIRHLVPVYPLIITALFGLAALNPRVFRVRQPLLSGLTLLLVIQFGGFLLHASVPARTVIGAQSAHDYRKQQIVGYEAVEWFNRNAPGDAVLLLLERRNNAYIGRPYFRTNPDLEKLVDTASANASPARFIKQAAGLGTTHLLVIWNNNVATGLANGKVRFRPDIGMAAPVSNFDLFAYRLVENNCASIVHASETRRGFSRTLGGGGRREIAAVLEFSYDRCPYPTQVRPGGWRRPN
jgi:4-amino-4-deoxy-L-arabinose transferase-like glycosyltransferase